MTSLVSAATDPRQVNVFDKVTERDDPLCWDCAVRNGSDVVSSLGLDICGRMLSASSHRAKLVCDALPFDGPLDIATVLDVAQAKALNSARGCGGRLLLPSPSPSTLISRRLLDIRQTTFHFANKLPIWELLEIGPHLLGCAGVVVFPE